ncbi:EF-hand domain-containing protein, variant 3 [Balamuthia mandrillaris]
MRGVWNCSRLNTPTSSSFHLFVRPTALSCRNFASNQNKSNLGAFAVGVGEFKRVYSPEKFYVDKTSYIPLLEKLDVNAIVSLRPRRFGKTLFADTLAQYYDAFNSPKFNELFGHLSVGKQRTPLANSFLVLPLTFAGLRTETAEEFKMSLNNELNSSASTFKARYNLNFQVNTHDALDTYKLLFDEMRLKQNKVYVIIDEYDASLNKTLGNGSFVSALSYSSEDHQNPLKRMENTYSEFFSKLKTACDIGVARCFITGVTPLVLSEFTSGFNIATHISDISRFSLMYGFTKSDVHNGLKRLDLADPVITALLEMWKREHDGYYFHPRAEEPLYNPTRILHGLQQIECLKVPDNLSSMELAIRLQEEIPKDSNSKPAESTLQAIREARYAPIVIEKLLAQEDATINIPGGAEEVFRLSHMNELATSPTPLLSFMRYMGALTYVPVNFNDRISYSLRIPNDVARREFTKALQDLLDLDETGKTDLRQAINVLVEKKELSPFCKAVSKHLLSRSNARDVILGEDPFAQGMPISC